MELKRKKQQTDPTKHRADGMPWWAPWAVIVILFLSWATSTSYLAWVDHQALQTRLEIRSLNVASCERVNLLRREVNFHTEVLRDFVELVAEDHQEAGHSEAAAQHRILTRRLQPVPLPDCEEVFPEESFATAMGEEEEE